ncbi:MAG TPA: hypothetical protein VHN55_09135, partial [Sphingomicrobium sp.]|nr:hypothetical protein [Sphingomicrobium sp.]
MNSLDQTATGIDETTITLGLQLAVTAGFAVAMVVLHTLGLVAISRLLRLKEERLLKHEFNLGAVGLLASFGFLVLLLHMLEIAVFGIFYMLVSSMDLEEALFYSASAYATLGWTADYFPDSWRLIGAVEALIGFILIGWSTAFMVTTMRKLS